MEKTDIPYLSASQLSHLIDKKDISPVEATEAYLRRIDDLDFKFNAYFTVCRDEARRAAKVAEQAIVKGNYLGPMHGIPVAIKDQLWTKGIRTTNGTRFLADFIPINCGFSSQGLPIGLQIGGRPFDEETVLKVAHAYEQNTPWHTMNPPNV